MKSSVFTIAANTFKETIRDRILYSIVGFLAVFVVAVLFLARLAAEDFVMIRSFGLAGVYLLGTVATIFLGASLIYKEIERRTLYFILSKPVRRWEVIVGKFLGLFAAVALSLLVMGVIYLGIVAFEGGGWDWAGFLAILFQVFEAGLLVALLVFFSSFTAPLTTTFATTLLLFLGHLLDSAVLQAKTMGAGVHAAALVFSYALPNFQKFNIRNLVVHDTLPAPLLVITVFGYAAVYTALLLIAASALFRKREL